MRLEELIKQDRFATASERAMLNIMATSSWVVSQLTSTMGEFGVTPAQYNVLRILQGKDPALMTCSDVGSRLLDRTPDVTRLLNRLEAAGHVVRKRAAQDRRIVEVGITETGRELLSTMHPHVEAVHATLARHLTEADLNLLNDTLDQYRRDQTD
ncbi:MAG: DNA-binding MarR family transcriptional regulator [Rhodothermales bacterium]|jgi:DNA-binding MarR family transcriptional regulator